MPQQLQHRAKHFAHEKGLAQLYPRREKVFPRGGALGLSRGHDGREDEEAFEVAIETIEYYPDNQIAINILAKRYPFFLSRAVVNSTEEDIKNFDLPLMRFALSPLFNPEGYKENFLSLSGGTIIESTEGN